MEARNAGGVDLPQNTVGKIIGPLRFKVVYEDLLQQERLVNFGLLKNGSAEQRSHPRYKTRICPSCRASDDEAAYVVVGECEIGEDLCPWAHSPAELRSAPAERFQYRMKITNSKGSLVFEATNGKPHALKRDAKAEVASAFLSFSKSQSWGTVRAPSLVSHRNYSPSWYSIDPAELPQARIAPLCQRLQLKAKFEPLFEGQRHINISLLRRGSPEQRAHPLYKTKICRTFDQPGCECDAKSCPFVHPPETLRPLPDTEPPKFLYKLRITDRRDRVVFEASNAASHKSTRCAKAEIALKFIEVCKDQESEFGAKLLQIGAVPIDRAYESVVKAFNSIQYHSSVRLAHSRGFNEWLGLVGALIMPRLRPKVANALRSEYKGFRRFFEAHGAHFKDVPPIPAQVESPSITPSTPGGEHQDFASVEDDLLRFLSVGTSHGQPRHDSRIVSPVSSAGDRGMSIAELTSSLRQCFGLATNSSLTVRNEHVLKYLQHFPRKYRIEGVKANSSNQAANGSLEQALVKHIWTEIRVFIVASEGGGRLVEPDSTAGRRADSEGTDSTRPCDRREEDEFFDETPKGDMVERAAAATACRPSQAARIESVKALLGQLGIEASAESVAQDIVRIRVSSMTHLYEVVNVIFDEAVVSGARADEFAALCERLSADEDSGGLVYDFLSVIETDAQFYWKSRKDHAVRNCYRGPFPSRSAALLDAQRETAFGRLLVDKCQAEFEYCHVLGLRMLKAEELSLQDSIAEASRNRFRNLKPIREELAKVEQRFVATKRRALGLVVFMGALSKRSLVTPEVMHECIATMVGGGGGEARQAHEFEREFRLLGSTCKALDVPEALQFMDYYFEWVSTPASNPELVEYFRRKCANLVALHADAWRPCDTRGRTTLQGEGADGEAVGASGAGVLPSEHDEEETKTAPVDGGSAAPNSHSTSSEGVDSTGPETAERNHAAEAKCSKCTRLAGLLVREAAKIAAQEKTIGQLQSIVDSMLCQICMEARIDTLLLPCMHTKFCGSCIAELAGCPVCLTPIQGKLRCRLHD